MVRVVLVTFKTPQHLPRWLEGLKKYLADAPCVLYSGRTRCGYDWICVQAFPSEEMADEESDIIEVYLETYTQSFEVHDFIPTKFLPSILSIHNKDYKKSLDDRVDFPISTKVIRL